MFESLFRLIFDLIQPTSQLIFLLIAGVGFLFAGRRHWALRLFAVFIFLWLLYATPLLPGFLIDRLENDYSVLSDERLEKLQSECDNDNILYIIILGAGHTPDHRLKPTHMLTSRVAMRLMEGIRVHQKLPCSRLVTSASAVYGELSQAEALKDAAISLGVDPGHIHTQKDPANTCQEAQSFVRDHGVGANVIIATSALHMRRAVMLFEQQGAQPAAAPAYYLRKKNPDKPFQIKTYLPSMKNIRNLESAIKEYAGYVWGRRTCRPQT